MKRFITILAIFFYTPLAFAGNVTWTGGQKVTGETIGSRFVVDVFDELGAVTATSVSSLTILGGQIYSDTSIGTPSEVTAGTVSGDTVKTSHIYVQNQLVTVGDKLDGEQIKDGTIDDDSLDLSDITLIDFTNDVGFGRTYWHDDGTAVYPLTATTVSTSQVTSDTIRSSFIHSDNTIGAEGKVTGTTVSGNTVKTGSYAFPVYSGSDNQILKFDGTTLVWEADATGVTTLTDSLHTVVGRGASTTTLLHLADIGADTITCDSVIATSVSTDTIIGSVFHSENIIGADGEVTGVTVSGDTARTSHLYIQSQVMNIGNRLDGEYIQDDTIDDDSIDFVDVTLADFTNDAGYLTSASEYWDESGGNIIAPVTATSVSGKTVLAGVIYSDNIIGCDNLITSNTISGITITGITVHLGYEGIPLPTGVPLDNQIMKYDATTGKWELESDSTGAGTTPSLNDIVGYGASTETEIDFKNLGAEAITCDTITCDLVTANSVQADNMLYPIYATIQFTVEQPDQIDTSDMLTIWSNESERNFNISEVVGYSDKQYDVIIGHTTRNGSDEGTVANFPVNISGTSLYYGRNSSVSVATITTNTIYFDATDGTPNHIKVTIKGYYD